MKLPKLRNPLRRSVTHHPKHRMRRIPEGMEVDHVTFDGHASALGPSGGGSISLKPTAPSQVEAQQLDAARRIEARLAGIEHQVARAADALEDLKPEVTRLANGIHEQNKLLREIREHSTSTIETVEAAIIRELPEPRTDS